LHHRRRSFSGSCRCPKLAAIAIRSDDHVDRRGRGIAHPNAFPFLKKHNKGLLFSNARAGCDLQHIFLKMFLWDSAWRLREGAS
jgi:hypothetical protein